MKERIMEFVRYKGLPVSTFEQMCGLSNAYVKNISKGVGADKLEKILNTFPELNRTWLLYGEGDMLIAGRDVYGTNTGQIRDDKQTAQDNAAPVFQNTGKGGNNVTQGAPASTIDKLIDEMRAQRESSEKQIDRLLTIIETITNTSK